MVSIWLLFEHASKALLVVLHIKCEPPEAGRPNSFCENTNSLHSLFLKHLAQPFVLTHISWTEIREIMLIFGLILWIHLLEEDPMKMLRSKILRDSAKLVIGALLLGGMVVGCGKDAANPDAVSLSELKAPGNMWIQDGGNGSVTLNWTGSNNEDDFDGYNVYGLNKAKITFGSYSEGQAIELLDEAGEPVEAAKTFLGQFNYNKDKPFEEAAVAAADGETEFSALPVHQKNGEDGIFPTCGVDAGVCKDHSTTFTRQAVSDNSARGVNGNVSYPVSGLKVGQTYCFFALSSMDEGAKVSMTSTNIACVTPRFKSEFSITLANDKTDDTVFDLHAFLATCVASGCKTGPTTEISDSALVTGATPRGAGAEDPGPVYIETFSGVPYFTPGMNVGVRDLGFYETGFADPTLPRSAPALVLDANVGTASKGPIINGGGYTPAGRSRMIEKNHVYVFAVPEKTATAPTSFYYHYVWVKAAATPGTAVAVEMRVSSVLNQR